MISVYIDTRDGEQHGWGYSPDQDFHDVASDLPRLLSALFSETDYTLDDIDTIVIDK